MSTVSLIATVKDEQRSIDNFLESLLSQSRAPDEIVIVDGGSTDGTAKTLDEAVHRDVRVRVISAPGSSIAEGRNIAIRAARGPIVAVTDAGAVPAPDWLDRLVAPLENDSALAVSAGFFEASGDTWFARCLGTVITPQLPEIDPSSFLPSSRSVAFRKEWWERVGGYPESLRWCEDLIFDLDLRRAGARFAFAPEAVVGWDARNSLAEYFRQYMNYARGDGHARLWGTRHVIRFSAYLSAAFCIGLGMWRNPLWSAAFAFAGAAYMRKFWLRLWRMPPFDDTKSTVCALAIAPLLVATGDVAKMVGYPMGVYERLRGGVVSPRPRAAG